MVSGYKRVRESSVEGVSEIKFVVHKVSNILQNLLIWSKGVTAWFCSVEYKSFYLLYFAYLSFIVITARKITFLIINPYIDILMYILVFSCL